MDRLRNSKMYRQANEIKVKVSQMYRSFRLRDQQHHHKINQLTRKLEKEQKEKLILTAECKNYQVAIHELSEALQVLKQDVQNTWAEFTGKIETTEDEIKTLPCQLYLPRQIVLDSIKVKQYERFVIKNYLASYQELIEYMEEKLSMNKGEGQTEAGASTRSTAAAKPVATGSNRAIISASISNQGTAPRPVLQRSKRILESPTFGSTAKQSETLNSLDYDDDDDDVALLGVVVNPLRHDN